MKGAAGYVGWRGKEGRWRGGEGGGQGRDGVGGKDGVMWWFWKLRRRNESLKFCKRWKVRGESNGGG